MTDGILSNLFSQGIWEGGKNLLRRISSRRYAQLFGSEVTSGGLRLVYATLTPPVAVTAEGTPSPFIFTKSGRDDSIFSMSAAVSGCELRAVKYLAESVAGNAGSWAVLTSDDEIAEKQDLSFVSFGLLSNRKTVDLLNNLSNPFARYEHNRFITKQTGRTIIAASQTEDCGVIVKIHPTNLPERTWICCGGFGEWGTSGAAWYLARKWREIRLTYGKGPFIIFVRVKPGQDESADRVIGAATVEELERQARGS